MKLTAALLLSAATLAAPLAAEEITVGMTAPLSGPQAFFGTTWHNGFKLYIDQLNENGGADGVTIKYVQQDDKADPREGTLMAQRFCDDESIIIGVVNFNSGVAQSTLPIYEDCEFPTLTFASNPTLTQQGYEYMVRPVANDLINALLPAEYAAGELGLKTAVIIHDKQVFGQGVSQIFAQNFTELGGEVTGTLAITATDVDFSAVLAQIKTLDPDAVYLGAVMPQLSLFARQLHEQGIETQLFVPDGGYTPDFISQAGEANAQGTIMSIQVPPMDASPAIAEFAEAYRARFGEDPGPYSVYGYVQAQIVEEVVRTAESHTREDMNAALHAIKVDTIVGELEFDETGELKTAPSFLYQVEGSDFKLIGQK